MHACMSGQRWRTCRFLSSFIGGFYIFIYIHLYIYICTRMCPAEISMHVRSYPPSPACSALVFAIILFFPRARNSPVILVGRDCPYVLLGFLRLCDHAVLPLPPYRMYSGILTLPSLLCPPLFPALSCSPCPPRFPPIPYRWSRRVSRSVNKLVIVVVVVVVVVLVVIVVVVVYPKGPFRALKGPSVQVPRLGGGASPQTQFLGGRV